jgi:lipopolysaccharide/colanic/teichoic acid biosynthesis glycosyltransferase
MNFYRNFSKRILDFMIASFGFVLLFPLFLIIALIVFFKTKDNPLFFQSRPGKDEKIFKVIKFKTMNNKRDQEGNLLPDSKRLTSIGRFIRSTSLDEIPQLINVIKGDMSLVGPRPLLEEYLLVYSDFQRRRHKVRPGISGWAQVNGRNAIDWEEKFQFDVWYVDHLSFKTDIRILWLTFLKVLKREGISQQGEATMKKFTGSSTSLVKT